MRRLKGWPIKARKMGGLNGKSKIQTSPLNPLIEIVDGTEKILS